MVRLELTPEEATCLQAVLEADLIDLRREIAHTSLRDFRRRLREREDALMRILGLLTTQAAGS